MALCLSSIAPTVPGSHEGHSFGLRLDTAPLMHPEAAEPLESLARVARDSMMGGFQGFFSRTQQTRGPEEKIPIRMNDKAQRDAASNAVD